MADKPSPSSIGHQPLLSRLSLPPGLTITHTPSSLQQKAKDIVTIPAHQFPVSTLKHPFPTVHKEAKNNPESDQNIDKSGIIGNVKEQALPCIDDSPEMSYEVDIENNKKVTCMAINTSKEKGTVPQLVVTSTEVVESEATTASKRVLASCPDIMKKRKKNKSMGKKRFRDPMMPKRPMSAFLCFSQEFRKAVQEEMESRDPGIVARELSVRWKLLDEVARKIFQARARSCKEQYEQALSSYRSSDGYHQRRLKLKAEKNLQRKILFFAGKKEHWSKGSSPYLAYIASHWKKVAAENPKMNGYQIQQTLWNNWYILQMSKRRHRKIMMAADDVVNREKSKTKVEENTIDQAESRSDKEIKTTDSSRTIVISPWRKVKLVSRSRCLEKELMKPGVRRVSISRPMNFGRNSQLPPGCTLSHVKKEEQAELHVKEKMENKDANGQNNVKSYTTEEAPRQLPSPSKSAYEWFHAFMMNELDKMKTGLGREEMEEALVWKWEAIPEEAREAFQEMAGQDSQRFIREVAGLRDMWSS